MEDFDSRVVSYYLSFNDITVAEKETCAKFDISSETLDYILMSDLVDNGL